MSAFVRTKPRLIWRGGALLGSAVVVAVVTGPTAYAAGSSGGGVDVVNTETVQVYMDADAQPTSKRVYEQLGLTGDGKVDLRNPIATRGLRNLDGFSSVDVKRGEQVVDTTVHGEKNYRTVSDFTGKLPLGVEVEYVLDGKRVQPGDVVGKSGELTVTYTVTNRTAEPQQVSWKDGDGNEQTSTEDVVVPMVGTLTTTVPNSFRDVSSEQANMAGDGKGGTKLSYTMTLFPPVGAPSATFGYTARITDGVVPAAEINALPVDPLTSPTFSKAAESYKGGAASGRELTEGASTIDTNLLKLRDGSQELLAGLLKLRDGSDELADGLAGKAVPGAKKLDAGANVLTAGLIKLAAGAGDLSDGTGKLSDGTKKALGGGKKLSAGLKQISGGLDQLQSQLTSKESQGGIQDIARGIDALRRGVGNADDPADAKTLIGGLAKLNATATTAKSSADSLAKYDLEAARKAIAEGTKPPSPTGGSVVQAYGASRLANGTLQALSASLDDPTKSFSKICATPDLPAGDLDPKSAACDALAAEIKGTVDAAAKNSGAAVTSLETSLATVLAIALRTDGIAAGTQAPQPAADDNLYSSAQRLRLGLAALGEGYTTLTDKLGAATVGITKLDDGAATASTGSDALASGLGDLDAGAGKLDAGAGKLDAGATKAAAGSALLSAGTATLADGLVAAGTGSEKLSAGLRKAADAAPQIPEGAQKLSEQGTKKLIEAGQDTTRTYAQNVAVIAASAERANTQPMVNGAPKGASSLTAYSFKLAGADGESSRNLVRTLGGAGVLAAGGGVLLLRRRFLV